MLNYKQVRRHCICRNHQLSFPESPLKQFAYQKMGYQSKKTFLINLNINDRKEKAVIMLGK